MQKQDRNHKKATSLCLAIASLSLLMPVAAKAANNSKEVERVKESGVVMKELVNADNSIPLDILRKAECVIILPSVKKAAFIVGGSYGRGVMTCRSGANFTGRWSAPSMMQSMGGSLGFQIGGQATDFVILVMNDKGAKALQTGKVKLGGDASIAAGPVGRTAEASTNLVMNAEMLSYSRAQGVFAGVSLSGSSLGPDDEANEALYGKKVSATDIVARHAVPTPASARLLLATLTAKAPRNTSESK
ncbi:MAG TPA: lipid-binding SYLF domain-containing protein [Acidisarcina sp.]|nr:lipid-binding SYLF domain-containing protein [Acidisarcina sp.]